MTPTDRALYPLILDLIAAVDPTTGLDEWRAALQRLRMAARSAAISDEVSNGPGGGATVDVSLANMLTTAPIGWDDDK